MHFYGTLETLAILILGHQMYRMWILPVFLRKFQRIAQFKIRSSILDS